MSTATERAVTTLRTDILTGALQPGQRVIQEDLADSLGVSRIPLREALQLLSSEGLVSHVPHRGYFVTELSVTDLQEVYRLRQILEAEAIRAALISLTDEDVGTLRDLAADVEHALATAEIRDVTIANRRFHFALFDASGMPRLIRLLHQLWDASDVYRALYFQQRPNRDRVRAEHAQMLDAIAARDADTTIRLHDEHRTHSVDWVRSRLLRQKSL